MDKNARCGHCVYWKPIDPERGECRVGSPKVVPKYLVFGAFVVNETAWPETKPADWCGSWSLDNAKKWPQGAAATYGERP